MSSPERRDATQVYCRDQWPVSDSGELTIGSLAIARALDVVGGTPAYLYDRGLIAAAITRVRDAVGDAELFYSIKANPFTPLVDFIAPLVDGFDVASGGELIKAACAGHRGASIQFSGPGKASAEIRAAVAMGAIVNVESPRQVADVAAACGSLDTPASVVLRINPNSVVAGGGLQMAGPVSQFGIDIRDTPDAVASCRAAGIEPLGFHFYWGTQCLDGDKIATAQGLCWKAAVKLAESNSVGLRYVNLGGGFGVPYHPGDKPVSLLPVKARLAEIRNELRSIQPEARLVVELGRYLVAASGIYVVRALDVKRSGGVTIVVSDGGMHQHLAASGNLGQGIRRSLPCCTPMDMRAAAQDEPVRVVGRLCTPIDVLCPEARLPALGCEDLIAIMQSGAYGASASPQEFLGHERVKELVL